MEKIMLIDGNSIANRAFFGVPLLTNSHGEYTNAVYGFFNILFKLVDEEKPDHIAVAFDLKAPTFRHIKYEAYKGTRKGMAEELRSQMPIIKELLEAMGIKQYGLEGFEADDLLGTLSKKAEEAGYETVVVSGDRDLLQLASDTLKIRIPKTKGGKTETEDYFAADVVEKYGVTPTEFIEVKALMGDASDNIPGVPSIGEKTAVKIIQEYKTVENAIAHAQDVKPPRASKNLIEFTEQARMSRFLVEIERNAPVELDVENMGTIGSTISQQAYDILKNLELKTIINRFTVEGTDEKKTEEKKKNYRLISSKFDMAEAVEKIENDKTFSFCLFEEDGFFAAALYSPSLEAVVIKNDESTVMSALKRIFENGEISKVGSDIKRELKILERNSIKISGDILDLALGCYVLNPTKDTYNFDDISSEFLGENVPSEEEVLGKGKSKKPYSSLSESEMSEFFGKQAEIIFNARPVIEEKIELNGQHELLYNIEMPLMFVLDDMENAGIKVDRKHLESFGKELEGEIEKITGEIYAEAGEEFNINSPKQLGVILFEKMGLKGSKKTKTGYSTNAEVLEKLKFEAPVVEKILLYRQLTKLKSTYADGLMAVLDKKTDRIYSTFNQTVTATGRISSTEPNLQNIPVRLELGRELRKVFIPQEDYVFVDADYSQIELRVLAHMADDENLINAFKSGQDIHRQTAARVLGIPFEDVTPLQRSQAKAINFGIVYGMSAFSLAQDLGITKKAAEEYIKNYFGKYPNVKKYLDKAVEDAKQNGYVSTIFNRRRAMPELTSSNFNMRSFGERVAMNMPIQGSAADIIKIAMINVNNALKEGGYKSRLILQVHDELLIETHKDEEEQVKKLLKDNMEHAVSLNVPLDVDVHSGKSWYEAK